MNCVEFTLDTPSCKVIPILMKFCSHVERNELYMEQSFMAECHLFDVVKSTFKGSPFFHGLNIIFSRNIVTAEDDGVLKPDFILFYFNFAQKFYSKKVKKISRKKNLFPLNFYIVNQNFRHYSIFNFNNCLKYKSK